MKRIGYITIVVFLIIVALTSNSCSVHERPDLRENEDVERLGEILNKYINNDMLVYELRLRYSNADRSFYYIVDEAAVVYSEKGKQSQPKAINIDLLTKKSTPNKTILTEKYAAYHGVDFTKFDYQKIRNSLNVALDSVKGLNIKGINSPIVISFDSDAWTRGKEVDGILPTRVSFDENDLSVGEIRLGVEEEVSSKKVLTKNEYTITVHEFYMDMDGNVKMRKTNKKTKKMD